MHTLPSTPAMHSRLLLLSGVAQLGIALLAGPTLVEAQQRVTRAEAVTAATQHNPRAALARADSDAARARLSVARQYENPVLGLAYSKSAPQQHVGLDIPIDGPWVRTPRIGAAMSALNAATDRVQFQRALLAFDADTAYTRAIALSARALLSRRTARDADSLLSLARLRRDAGDASDLDVELASLIVGQAANAAAADSLDAVNGTLTVQLLMGLPAQTMSVTLVDTLALESTASVINEGATSANSLLETAAEAEVKAAEFAVTLERRLRFGVPSLSLGFETHDPEGIEKGALPTVGISVPFPIFNRNGANTLVAIAERDRARALLEVTRLEVRRALAEARRNFIAAERRAERSAQLVAGAERVAAMSVVAYREGASTLPNVLEAQRAARESRAQYLDDVAAARNASSLVRLLSITSTSIQP